MRARCGGNCFCPEPLGIGGMLPLPLRAPAGQYSVGHWAPLGIGTERKGSPFGSSEAIVYGSDCRGQSHLDVLSGEARLKGRTCTYDYIPGNGVTSAPYYISKLLHIR